MNQQEHPIYNSYDNESTNKNIRNYPTRMQDKNDVRWQENDDRHVRFLAKKGQEGKSISGICPICIGFGKVGAICLLCSEGKQFGLIGTCRFCSRRGPQGHLCRPCGSEYEPEVFIGVCPHCYSTGIRGTPCNDCAHKSMVFE